MYSVPSARIKNMSARQLEGNCQTPWKELIKQVPPGYSLCAVVDHHLTFEEREKMQAELARLPHMSNMMPVYIQLRCFVLDSEADLNPKLWEECGWVIFYAI